MEQVKFTAGETETEGEKTRLSGVVKRVFPVIGISMGQLEHKLP